MIELSCEECGASFRVKPYRRSKARFCSFRCGGAWHARTRLNGRPKTYMRGNKFRAGKPPANAFTSEQVRGSGNPRWQSGSERVCAHCGLSFRQKPWVERQNGPARFCSRACFWASGCFTGEKSSSWVGGPQTYRGRGWRIARAAVVAEQNGACADCTKMVGKSLPVHHRKPYRLFTCSEEANQRSNLVGLCQSCHMKQERQAALFIEKPKPAKQETLDFDAHLGCSAYPNCTDDPSRCRVADGANKNEPIGHRDFDPVDDLWKSEAACREAVRDRVAAGGPGWEPK